MKLTWEARDIVPGRRVRTPKHPAQRDLSSEVWLIAYSPSSPSEDEKYALVSLLDGMLSVRDRSRGGLAAFLNESGCFPVELLETKFWQIADEQVSMQSETFA